MRVEHLNGYVLWAVDSSQLEFRKTANWRQVWESSREGKVEVLESKKINSLRAAKTTGVSTGQRNWDEMTR